MAGRPQLPLQLIKRCVTIRLRPWLVQLVKDESINLSELVEGYLLYEYGHLLELDNETTELAEKFKVELPILVNKSIDKNTEV